MEKKQGTGPIRREVVATVVVGLIGLMLGLNLFLFFDEDNTFNRSAPAPDFELPLFGTEETQSLSDHRGEVVLMDFWATWCAPCREQMPALEAVARDAGVVVLSINTDEEDDRRLGLIEAFLKEEGLSIATLLDDGSVRSLYRVGRIPTLVVVDREGMISHTSAGVHGEDRLRELIEAAR